ncbi:M48 family metalloprotease [Vibrio cholerae]|nr:M48 family metalloprotease [Vibrio cholerae]
MNELDAFHLVRLKVDQVCDATGIPRARVEIVERLHGTKGPDFTAHVRSERGSPVIDVPLRVVREYPDAALTWLLAHEVCHYKRFAGRRMREKLLTAGMVGFGALLGVGALWFVVSTFINQDGPEGGIFVVAGMFAYTGYMALVFADSRAEEREADRFAVKYAGTLDGALQWAALTHLQVSKARRGVGRLRAVFDPFNRWAGLVFSTHPYVPLRIDAMRAELERVGVEKSPPSD